MSCDGGQTWQLVDDNSTHRWMPALFPLPIYAVRRFQFTSYVFPETKAHVYLLTIAGLMHRLCSGAGCLVISPSLPASSPHYHRHHNLLQPIISLLGEERHPRCSLPLFTGFSPNNTNRAPTLIEFPTSTILNTRQIKFIFKTTSESILNIHHIQWENTWNNNIDKIKLTNNQ